MERYRYTLPPSCACLKPEIKSFICPSKYIMPPTGNKGSRLSPSPLRAPKSGLEHPPSCTFSPADKGQMPWSPEHPSLKPLCHVCRKGMKLCFCRRSVYSKLPEEKFGDFFFSSRAWSNCKVPLSWQVRMQFRK